MKKAASCIFGLIFLTSAFFPYTPAFAMPAQPQKSALTTEGSVLHVETDGTGSSCATWAQACSLQTALEAAAAGDQIWVAQGFYHPSPTDPNSYFTLNSGVAMYGGFNGTETALEQRDWTDFPTILSGEIGDPQLKTDNSRIIMTAGDTNEDTRLDGFTITSGYNTDNWGSGLYAYGSLATFANLVFQDNAGNQGGAATSLYGSPILEHVTFTGNHAAWGGGLYNMYANPVLTDVTFTGNTAVEEGGGMYDMNCSPTLTRVVFDSNNAQKSGGGMYTYDGSPVLTDVSFLRNSTTLSDASVYDGGAGMFNFGPSSGSFNTPVLRNVTFAENTSADEGGGMYNLRDVNSTLTNVTFSNNTAAKGGGLSNFIVSHAVLTDVTFSGNTSTSNVGGAIYNYSTSILNAVNSIVWGNSSPQVSNAGATLTLDYSAAEAGCPAGDPGGVTCSNLVTTNPLLQPLADNGGFTLTQALPAGSSAIDMGDPRTCPPLDQRGFFRPINGDSVPGARCDIGSYEYGSFLPEGTILYTAPAAAGYCSSWADACDLQTALDHAEPGYQIWARQGTYLPTFASNPADARTSAFVLKPGASVYGGFAGNETSLDQRDWLQHESILSGNIGSTASTADNSYHVVASNDLDAGAVLDGFTIRAGNANGSLAADQSGAGIVNNASSPTFANLVILNNNAAQRGGGMYNLNSKPALSQVTFENNSAFEGGGMANYQSAPDLSQVSFTRNSAAAAMGKGGGMYNEASSPVLKEVIFSENAAKWWGGGMCNFNSSSPTLDQVLFVKNRADLEGGGLFNKNQSNPSLVNVTFSENTSGTGGGMYSDEYCTVSLTNVTFFKNLATTNGGAFSNHHYSATTLQNSIAWGNLPNQVFDDLYGTTTAGFSDIDQDGFAGSSNIRLDPMLLTLANNGGFSLTHALHSGSPAIDAGNPAVCPEIDQRGYLRPADGNGDGTALCDMGAFEYGSEAGYTLTITTNGLGSVTRVPAQDFYQPGQSVSLIPVPAPGWRFAGWSGDASGTEDPLVLTVHTDLLITAAFKQYLFLPLILR